jgi:hypothetical protein
MLELEHDIPKRAIYLFFRIVDGHKRAEFFAYYLEYLVFHMPEKMLIPSLEWLIAQGLTGDRFMDFVYNDCAASGLELIRHLTMRLERDRKTRSLYSADIR